MAPASASDPVPDRCRAGRPETASVERTGVAGILVLADGRTVRLADVAIATGAAGDEALRRLGALAARTVTIHPVGAGPDRYGDLRAHVALSAGDEAGSGAGWLQASLVGDGLAHVAPDVLASPCVDDLLPVEDAARGARAGLWGEGRWPVPAGMRGLADRAGQYAFVEGRVLTSGESRQVVYLNFGRDWATDFTVLVRKSDLRGWPAEARDVTALVGSRVRARGRLESWNGGLIRVEHPAQIEVVAAP